MNLKIACQMDPIEGINVAGDSTFAILLEAQARGFEIFYYTPDELSLDEGRVCAFGSTLKVFDREQDFFQLSEKRSIELASMDVVLLRQDPPFDMGYISTTHLLERIHPGTLVVNDPAHVRNAPEKLFVFEYLDLMPPTMVTRSVRDAYTFRDRYGDIIIKPLYGNGGQAVFRVKRDDSNLSALVEMFQAAGSEPFIVQEFRREVSEGDKRIILVDGEIAGAINRVPLRGQTRSNLGVGGRAEAIELNDRDLEICERLMPELKRRGLLFTGIDVIGPYLTEINVTSPTGIRQISGFGGNDIAAMIWDAIERKVRVDHKK